MEENRIFLSDQQIKNELKKMLKEFDEWASSSNMKYSIIAGTLLGAVRHGGFIPWDDDIDICMDRYSYNKFINILKKHGGKLTNNLGACGFELGNSDMPYVKIINKNIKCYEQPYPDDDKILIKSNLWIDVFPIDGIPDKCSKLYNKIRSIVLILYYNKRQMYYGWHQKKFNEKNLKSKIKYIIYMMLPYKAVIKMLINISKFFDIKKCKYVSNNVWGEGLYEAFPKTVIENYIDFEFEDISVKGFKEGKQWLSIRYGDYMTLPPENQRNSHGIKAWIE
ncbi:MAG: LicD family protein [Clostridium sp.]|nr:LicD family protein [Clostridium sp.]